MKFSWNKQPRPIIALSPMADMTDSPFCRIAKQWGAKIVFREMVSSEAVVRGNEKTLGMTAFSDEEHPLIQQIFGKDPDVMAEAARIIEDQFHPDGIDINMGCPVYKITSDFNGAALMREPKIAGEIVRKVKAAIKLPLSVKTRLGWNDPDDILEFAPHLEHAGADLISVHGRTKKQGYTGVADWKRIGEVKKRVSVPVLANGDIRTPEDAVRALDVTGADGILVARGALGNPWRLKQMEEMLSFGEVKTVIGEEARKRTILKHFDLMAEEHGEDRAAILMRKHMSWYYKGIPGAKNIRYSLVRITSRSELISALDLL